ncbi:MAG: hypothetical protein QGG40_03560 [Myxococcota bacterium]|nr:hypothetical protein [Myxococcota bacterium]
MTARLEYQSAAREYFGPAVLTVEGEELPFILQVEDFELAEVFEFRVDSMQPVTFGAVAGNLWSDTGTFVWTGDRMVVSLTRTYPDGDPAKVVILGNTDPQAQAPPSSWLDAGTRLYFGITYDDKPITRLVPEGLNVMLRENGDRRELQWVGDLDPATQVDVTGELFRSGVRVISPEAVDSGQVFDDRFTEDEEGEVEFTSLFLSRQTYRTLTTYGGAAFHDAALGEPGVLERISRTKVVIQADDNLWQLPAVVAQVHGGRASYLVAEFEEQPLVLAAARPGYQVRLMAIGRPRDE